jgi:hypothetical protein
MRQEFVRRPHTIEDIAKGSGVSPLVTLGVIEQIARLRGLNTSPDGHGGKLYRIRFTHGSAVKQLIKRLDPDNPFAS